MRRLHYFLIFLIFLVVLVGVIFSLSFEEKIDKNILFCGDGTVNGTCSLSKPYFCEGRVLVENVFECGCPDSLNDSEGKCNSSYFHNSSNLNLSYIFEGELRIINFTLYKGIIDYLAPLPRSIVYEEGVIPQRKDFKLKKIDDPLQKEALMPLVVAIQNLAPGSKEDQARIAISLVQMIKYGEPEFVSVLDGRFSVRAARYPYQVIYEELGSCEGKSELLTFLLREIGYGVSMFYYGPENHEVAAIKCPVKYSLNGTGYCFIETTIPSPLSYSEGRYLGLVGSGILLSSPEFVFISEGISLGEKMKEYDDAKDLNRIVNKVDATGKVNYFEKKRLDELRIKYGLLY